MWSVRLNKRDKKRGNDSKETRCGEDGIIRPKAIVHVLVRATSYERAPTWSSERTKLTAAITPLLLPLLVDL